MQYRKKPVIIEAIKYTGDNSFEIIEFTKGERQAQRTMGDSLIIPTLEGNHECKVGDFVIKGVEGKFYPCKPNIFEKTYEQI